MRQQRLHSIVGFNKFSLKTTVTNQDQTRNGSFLVFLPGKRELQLLAERLDELPDLQVRCIFGGRGFSPREKVYIDFTFRVCLGCC